MIPDACCQFSLGRRFLGRLPRGGDLNRCIEIFCRRAAIQTASFSVIGSVSSCTLGVFDQSQQVYVTIKETEPFELAACTGNVSLEDGNPIVKAHAVLGNEKGKIIGGRIFSETLVFGGELDLQELIGDPLTRSYDQETGLMLWNMPLENAAAQAGKRQSLI
jgi:predicted DNA-binding protein with PD1-like motif